MFRRIRSNRNPRDTLYSELKKELAPYHKSLRAKVTKVTQQYPKFLFAMMVINITLSAILVISIHRPPPQKPFNIRPISTGFDQVRQASAALRQTILLKQQVDSILSKKPLSAKDSIALEKALDQLQQIKKQSP